MGRPRKVTGETSVAQVRSVKQPLTKEHFLQNIRLSIKCKNETQKNLVNKTYMLLF